MPSSSGFANTPVSKFLVGYTVMSALLATATDTKYFFHLMPVPHLFGTPYSGQWWRLLTWPLCYANSTEVLFGAMTFYQLRVVERLWGSSKFATFLVTTIPYTVVLPPILLLMLRFVTGGMINHLPSGPTSLAFALLAQYHAAIPYSFRYQVSTSSPTPQASNEPEPEEKGFMLTSKSTSYLLPAQLAFSQLPGSLIPAIVGWVVGYAWRAEILPTFPRRSWRVPNWVTGEKRATTTVAAGVTRGGAQSVEELRRRMELQSGRATGVQEESSSSAGRRRFDAP